MTATKVKDYSSEVLDPDYEGLTEKAHVVGSTSWFLESLPGYEQVHSAITLFDATR